MINIGAVYALVAAALFGLSTPLQKLLLGGVGPQMLAALLYLGSGFGLAIVLVVKRLRGTVIVPIPKAARLKFAAAVLFGGVLAPVLLLMGLHQSTATSASLLLNLEGVFTALLAWLVARENAGRRVVLGMMAIVAAGAVLSFQPTADVPISMGALFIAAACLCWAIDNNLTQSASSADPALVATVKGIGAGTANLIIAVVLGSAAPTLGLVASAGAVGFVSYGLSLVFFVLGLRHLGTARTGAYFSIAPFIGAGLSFCFVQEPISARFVVGAVLMGIGVWLHLSERHEHFHVHEPTLHAHPHVHDDHHRHDHLPSDPVGEPHTHEHRHESLAHAHAHEPDIHHRHSH